MRPQCHGRLSSIPQRLRWRCLWAPFSQCFGGGGAEGVEHGVAYRVAGNENLGKYVTVHCHHRHCPSIAAGGVHVVPGKRQEGRPVFVDIDRLMNGKCKRWDQRRQMSGNGGDRETPKATARRAVQDALEEGRIVQPRRLVLAGWAGEGLWPRNQDVVVMMNLPPDRASLQIARRFGSAMPRRRQRAGGCSGGWWLNLIHRKPACWYFNVRQPAIPAFRRDNCCAPAVRIRRGASRGPRLWPSMPQTRRGGPSGPPADVGAWAASIALWS